MNEKKIIEYFNTQAFPADVALGIGDDAAIINISDQKQLVITTDSMVLGRHFVKQSPAYLVGYKLMARNISDIAAMAATPKWATLNLALADVDEYWLEQFSQGLFACASQHDIALVGGDTTSGPEVIASLQLIGEITKGEATLREHAQEGDCLFVTGVLGSASASLKQLEEHGYQHSRLSDTQLNALYKPASRIQLALELRQYVNASIDISDGLLHELETICQRSHVGATLELDNIPLNVDIDLMTAVTGGEDYELLFTAKQTDAEIIKQIGEQHNCKVTQIGTIIEGDSIQLLLNGKQQNYPSSSGYDHFKE